jgi:transporter family-2 protein
MKIGWIFPFIILGGALQTCGAAMNAQLNQSLANRWLASAVSFAVITAFFACLFAVFPSPLPSAGKLAAMPWWAPLGGLVGAVQVYAGLTLVNKVGAGPFTGVTVTAALITSLVVDHYGWFRMPVHAVNPGRIVGAVLMTAGIALIAKF